MAQKQQERLSVDQAVELAIEKHIKPFEKGKVVGFGSGEITKALVRKLKDIPEARKNLCAVFTHGETACYGAGESGKNLSVFGYAREKPLTVFFTDVDLIDPGNGLTVDTASFYNQKMIMGRSNAIVAFAHAKASSEPKRLCLFVKKEAYAFNRSSEYLASDIALLLINQFGREFSAKEEFFLNEGVYLRVTGDFSSMNMAELDNALKLRFKGLDGKTFISETNIILDIPEVILVRPKGVTVEVIGEGIAVSQAAVWGALDSVGGTES